MKGFRTVFFVAAAFVIATAVGVPSGTAQAEPPHLDVDKSAVRLAECQTARVTLVVEGAGDPAVERRPLEVVEVLDRSGSMDNAGGDPPQPITDMKIAAGILLGELDPELDRTSLVSYASEASLDQRLTSNFSDVRNAISNLTAGGYTNIGGGVAEAQAELANRGRPEALPVIVLLSDGVANRSHAGDVCETYPVSPTLCTEDAVEQARLAKDAGTVLYTIGLNLDGVDAEYPGAGVLARETLQAMASGPDYYFEAPSSEDLEGIFEDIAQQLTEIAGTNVTVTDVLPEGIHYIADTANPPPTTVSGQTLTWGLGTLTITDTVSITLDVSLDSRDPGQLTNVFLDSRVDYVNYQGEPDFAVFPETRVSPIPCEPWLHYLPLVCRDCCDERPVALAQVAGRSGSSSYRFPDRTGPGIDAIQGALRYLLQVAHAPGSRFAVIGSGGKTNAVTWYYSGGDRSAALASVDRIDIVNDWSGSWPYVALEAALNWCAQPEQADLPCIVIFADDFDINYGGDEARWDELVYRARDEYARVYSYWIDMFGGYDNGQKWRRITLERAHFTADTTRALCVEVYSMNEHLDRARELAEAIWCPQQIPDTSVTVSPSVVQTQAQDAEPPPDEALR